jgi:hypothetical protein
MPEGLSPIEAGRKLHEHGEAHERADEAAPEHADTPEGEEDRHERHSRIVQIGEAVLLALVTLAAAWAGYSAARWNTTSRIDIAQASTLRSQASRHDLTAQSERNFDSSTFEAWFTAFVLGNQEKERIAIRRFRPIFREAFDAWMATNPLENPHAAPGPTYMPQYKLPAAAKATALDNEATAKFNAGNQAGSTSDDFVRITVFLAAVLFLIGIGSSFKLHGVRYALIVLGTALLILSIVQILQQPGLPH